MPTFHSSRGMICVGEPSSCPSCGPSTQPLKTVSTSRQQHPSSQEQQARDPHGTWGPIHGFPVTANQSCASDGT
ncbi:hypothetical protein ACOMHN_065214 [Nucella lapillus]